MVVAPIYELLPDSVNDPVPDLVKVPVLVAIGSATVISPAPVNVKCQVPVIALPVATSVSGATTSTSGGYRYYYFATDGSITF